MIKYCYILFFVAFICGCNENVEKEIAGTYPDGTVSKEYHFKWYGNTRVKVKEIRYFADGTKQSEATYNKDEKKHGKWVTWYESGKKWLEENYKNDIKDGAFIEWYMSGDKNFEGSFKNGLPDGEWIFWDNEGNKIKKVYYENGKKVKEQKYD